VAPSASRRRPARTAPLLVAVLAFVSCSIWTTGTAVAKSHSTATAQRQLVLRPAFQPVRAGVDHVWTSGEYMLSSIANGLTTAPILVNERTRTSTSIDTRCYAVGLGDPWLWIACPQIPNTQLYSLATGVRETVTPSPNLPQCVSPESYCAAPDAVGQHWIRFDATCYHCADSYYFQNIQTGALRSDPTDATTFADLNSPTLAHKVCSQVHVLRVGAGDYFTIWGSLTFSGSFALATGTDTHGNDAAYLERCGTRGQRLLATGAYANWLPPVAVNASVIVWQASPRRLNGLFLPSLQPFVIALPDSVVTEPGFLIDPYTRVRQLALTSRSLYLLSYDLGELWRTPIPSAPAKPVDVRPPTVTRQGQALTCTRGTWRFATSYSYSWIVDGGTRKGARNPHLAVTKGLKGQTVACKVTASNATGTTTSSSAPFHVH
jgi:hypothetical protein